jgi:hypothetical protein
MALGWRVARAGTEASLPTSFTRWFSTAFFAGLPMPTWCCFLLFGCLLLPQRGVTQAVPAALLEYQGRYEYLRHTTLDIVASPRDGRLYTIVAGARYPLYQLAGDVFRNGSQDTVRFQRDAAGRVSAYTYAHQRFRLLTRQVQFPAAMWYPRPVAAGHPFAYQYVAPHRTADGLPVGTLAGTGLDPQRLATMVTKIVDGTYPNVHSVLIIKDGKLVFEEYFYEYSRETLHPLRSASKSIVSALTGQAVAQGLLPGVQGPVCAAAPVAPQAGYYGARPAHQPKRPRLRHCRPARGGQ